MRAAHLILLLLVLTALSLVVAPRFNRANDATTAPPAWNPFPENLTSQTLSATAPATLPAANDTIKRIRIMCPRCHTVVVVPETSRGEVVTCAHCALLFRIPTHPPTSTPTQDHL